MKIQSIPSILEPQVITLMFSKIFKKELFAMKALLLDKKALSNIPSFISLSFISSWTFYLVLENTFNYHWTFIVYLLITLKVFFIVFLQALWVLKWAYMRFLEEKIYRFRHGKDLCKEYLDEWKLFVLDCVKLKNLNLYVRTQSHSSTWFENE